MAGAKEKKHSHIDEIVVILTGQVKCRLRHKVHNVEDVELNMPQLIVSRGFSAVFLKDNESSARGQSTVQLTCMKED